MLFRSGDASCPLFVKAEEDFNLSITAVGWEEESDVSLCEGNPVTPNFRLSDIPLSSEVVAPSGGDDGIVTPLIYSHTRSADATETVSVNVSEVGVFRFKADPGTGTYLGLTAPGGSSGPTGRFYPDRFEVTVDRVNWVQANWKRDVQWLRRFLTSGWTWCGNWFRV